MPALTPERYAQLVDELQRCEAYFTRLSTELDPTGRLHSATLIYWVKRHISDLKDELERNQATPPPRYDARPHRRGR